MSGQTISLPELSSITAEELERRLATCYRIILDSARRAQEAAESEENPGRDTTPPAASSDDREGRRKAHDTPELGMAQVVGEGSPRR